MYKLGWKASLPEQGQLTSSYTTEDYSLPLQATMKCLELLRGGWDIRSLFPETIDLWSSCFHTQRENGHVPLCLVSVVLEIEPRIPCVLEKHSSS